MHLKQGSGCDAPNCEQSKHHQLRQWYDHKSTGPKAAPILTPPYSNKLRPSYLLDYSPGLHLCRVSQLNDRVGLGPKNLMVRQWCAVSSGSYTTGEKCYGLEFNIESGRIVEWDSWMPGRSQCETWEWHGVEESDCEAMLHVSSWQSNQVPECSSGL